MKAESPFDCLKPEAIAALAEDITYGKATKPVAKTFQLAIFAGAFIAIAFIFYITVVSQGGSKLAGGLCFSLGLILCVILGGELFTSTTLTLVAKAAKRISWSQMLRNWALVYSGNLVGGLIMVALIMLSSQYTSGNGQWGLTALNVAQHKLHHTFVEAVALGILCNLMVCLAAWMAFGGRTMISADPAKYADLTVSHFIFKNLIPVTIGNIIGGGVMIGLTNWFIFRRHH